MEKKKDGPIGQDIIAKIPVQDTRLFYKRWENYENLNNLLLNEIMSLREKDPKFQWTPTWSIGRTSMSPEL